MFSARWARDPDSTAKPGAEQEVWPVEITWFQYTPHASISDHQGHPDLHGDLRTTSACNSRLHSVGSNSTAGTSTIAVTGLAVSSCRSSRVLSTSWSVASALG